MKDWAQTFWCCGASDGKSLNSPVVPRLERNSARSTAQLRTVWPRGAAKKKKEKKDRRRGKWDIRVRFPTSDEESNESFLDDETACDDDLFIFGTRDSLSPRKIFTALEEVFVSTANCVQVTFRNFPCYGSKGISVTFFLFYALVDIVIRFLDPDLSLIIYLSVIEVKTEGNRHRD